MRDGRWKFIGPQTGSGEEEFFDLSVDPGERQNLAGEHPEKVARYECLCQAWYMRANDDFLCRYEGGGSVGRTLRGGDCKRAGPKLLAFGNRSARRIWLLDAERTLQWAYISRRLSTPAHAVQPRTMVTTTKAT